MARDVIRDLLRAALVLLMVTACCQSFYFIGELSGNEKKEQKENLYYDNSESYYEYNERY